MADLRPSLDAQEWATHAAFVRRLARSLLASGDRADDVAQETWLTLQREPPRDRSTLRAWLSRVVHNLVRMEQRSGARRDRRERAVASPEAQPAAAEAVAQIDLHRRVVEQVLQLAEPYRTVIALRFYEQRPLAEIARELGIPLETVKTRQKRALQQLRAELLGDAKEDDASDPRWSALVLLAKGGGGGGIAMTVGVKWGMAAGIVALAFVGYSVWPDARPHAGSSDLDARAVTPASAEATTPPVAAVVERSAEPVVDVPVIEAPVVAVVPFNGIHARVRGDVVDGGGRPLANRRVEIYGRDGQTGADAVVASATTDVQGGFELVDVPFRRRASGVAMARDGASCTGVEFDPRTDRPIHLVLGATKTMVGRVVDESGEPVAGAALIASSRSRGSSLHSDRFMVPHSARGALTVRSGDDGSFVLPELPCGWQVYVDVECAGFASNREKFVVDESPAEFTATIVLFREAFIEGSVTFADGSPAAGIRIGAQIQAQSTRMRNSWGDSVSDSTGHYLIRGLEAGSWNVLVMLDEEQQEQWCAAASEGVKLDAGAPPARANFVLSRGGELVVKVLDATTKLPVPEQWIGVQSAARSSSGAAINSMVSDADGIARIRVPPGAVHAYLSADSQTWSQQDGIVREGETLSLTVELVVAVTLRGRVVAPDGSPVANAQVWSPGFRRMHRTPKTTTKDDGSFELENVPRADEWQLRAAAKGLAMPVPQIVASDSGDAEGIELQLVARPPNTLRGRVVDVAGVPVAGAEVTATERTPDPGRLGDPSSPDPATRTRSAADGTYELHGLWPEFDYLVYASRMVETGDTVRIDVDSAEVKPLLEFETRDLLDLVLHPQQ